MLRSSRRLTALLLWLALALLPLRGLATAWMPLATGPGSGGAVALAVAAPPCHAAMAGDDGGDTSAAAPATCSMCDLCHSAAADAPVAPALPAAVPEAAPQAAPAVPIEARLSDGPFRPPRPTLA